MLTFEKIVLMNPDQYQIVIDGMRNPKNSWDRSDSFATHLEDDWTMAEVPSQFFIGENDYDLMRLLSNGGPVHAKFRRMMPVWITITAPLYWWKEFDTYKVGTVANSCSTMHKIHSKEFTPEDFSTEHLYSKPEFNAINVAGGLCEYSPEYFINMTCQMLNHYREKYLASKEKDDWWQLIQLLPSSYNQKRTVMLNYEVLHNIYISRKNHKLDEWHKFCDWIETLPYSDLITVSFEDNKE